MNIYFIENDSSITQILASAEFAASRDLIVCVNYLAYLAIKQQKPDANAVFIEELFSRKQYTELHAVTDRFATDWRFCDGIDQTVLEDISFGEASAIMVPREYMTNVLVKYGEAIRLAVAANPGVTHLIHDLANQNNSFQFFVDDGGRFFNKELLVSMVATQLGLECRFCLSPEPVPIRSTSRLDRFVASRPDGFKAQMMSVAKDMLAGLSNLLYSLRRRSNSECPIYFFNYFNISSLLNHLGRGVIIPTMTPSLLFSGFRCLDFLKLRVSLGETANNFLGQIARTFRTDNAAESKMQFVYNDIDYGGIYRPVIEEIAITRIPQLVRYAAQIRRGIETFRIRRLITADVMSEMGKIRVAVCRKAGVEIIFVDHGIMGHRFVQSVCRGAAPDLIIKPEAREPVTDDYPYELHAPAVTLGNPSMDPYPASKRKRVRRVKKVLFTTFAEAYYGRLDRYAYQELYFKELFSAIPALLQNDIEIHYRPHSENIDYHKYLFRFFGIDSSRVRFSEWKTPFRELIFDMDLLVCSVSNVFYEAQAAGVPTIFLDPAFIPDALWPPLNGKNWDEVIRLSTGKELAELILRNRDNADELNQFLDSFLDKHAHDYMHTLDGMAGRRIAGYIANSPPPSALPQGHKT